MKLLSIIVREYLTEVFSGVLACAGIGKNAGYTLCTVLKYRNILA